MRSILLSMVLAATITSANAVSIHPLSSGIVKPEVIRELVEAYPVLSGADELELGFLASCLQILTMTKQSRGSAADLAHCRQVHGKL